jgi:hypothetical protein
MTKPNSYEVKLEVELTWEMVDRITVDQLRNARNSLMHDLERPVPGVFVMDPAVDKKLIQDHIDALNLVISYFSVPTLENV